MVGGHGACLADVAHGWRTSCVVGGCGTGWRTWRSLVDVELVWRMWRWFGEYCACLADLALEDVAHGWRTLRVVGGPGTWYADVALVRWTSRLFGGRRAFLANVAFVWRMSHLCRLSHC